VINLVRHLFISVLILCSFTSGSISHAGQMVPNEVLVKFEPYVSEDMARAKIEAVGGRVISMIPEIRVFHVEITDGDSIEATIAEFEADADCLYAEANRLGGGSGQLPNDPRIGNGSSDQWHHFNVNSIDAWALTRGSNDVISSILDTGWQSNNPEFSGSRFLRSRDVTTVSGHCILWPAMPTTISVVRASTTTCESKL